MKPVVYCSPCKQPEGRVLSCPVGLWDWFKDKLPDCRGLINVGVVTPLMSPENISVLVHQSLCSSFWSQLKCLPSDLPALPRGITDCSSLLHSVTLAPPVSTHVVLPDLKPSPWTPPFPEISEGCDVVPSLSPIPQAAPGSWCSRRMCWTSQQGVFGV